MSLYILSHDLHSAEEVTRAQKGLRPHSVPMSPSACHHALLRQTVWGIHNPVAIGMRGSDTIALMFRMALQGGLMAIFHSGLFLIYCDTEYICGEALGYRMCVERVHHPARSIHL